jgi:hypothetical protein
VVTSLIKNLLGAQRGSRRLNLQNPERGQTALETAFVFTSIVFFAFVSLNAGIYLHTYTVASYAAFMGARSYQVYGNTSGREYYQERSGSAGDERLLDSEKNLTVIRTAEDIFTCALPWVVPPKSDILGSAGSDQARAGCMEGERKYEKTNINKSITFYKYDDNALAALSGGGGMMETLQAGFKEKDREPMRYAIMQLRFRNPLIFNVFGVFDGADSKSEGGNSLNRSVREKIWHKVHVPALLNPGLESGLVDRPTTSDEEEE